MNIPEYEIYHETKKHSESIFPYNTYLCSIPLDFYEVPNHWHNEMEIIYIKKGKGTVSIDMHSHYVEAGDIIIVIPGQLHSISQLDKYSMEYENIIFSTDMLISKISDTLETDFFIPLLAGNIAIKNLITADDDIYNELALCLNKADNICRTFPKGYKLALKACLYEFFFVIYTNSEEISETKSNKNVDRIKTILNYLEANYRHDISIEEIADVCGFSSSHFMKFFKKNMGDSFINYLNDYRLSMAARTLLSSDDNIIDIAADCGYDNLSYFNRIFKKKYGVTPSTYRKSSGSGEY
jgi:AraC-like DNA-binding protein/mannose-6-phosphate isomerase-like protein (cupin superfamily)